MIYLTGDTHIPIDIDKIVNNFPQQNYLDKNDYLIILGDFGLYWKKNDVFYKWYEWIQSRNFTTLWVDGNHENYDMIAKLPVLEWNGGLVQRDGDIIHLMRGNVYTIEDNKFFVFGGAYSIDKAYRQNRISWWEEEEYSLQERKLALTNLDKHDWKVDYVLTHACPYIIKEIMFGYRDETSTELFLEQIKNKLQFKDWYFGHYHEYKDYQNYHELYYDIRRLGT
jgi:DNA repair exonuclease SbcCD nuclease subunit